MPAPHPRLAHPTMLEAGGGFKVLADRLGAIELTEVYRQEQAWDRAALDQLRHGDISEWVAAYDQHGRLVQCRAPTISSTRRPADRRLDRTAAVVI